MIFTIKFHCVNIVESVTRFVWTNIIFLLIVKYRTFDISTHVCRVKYVRFATGTESGLKHSASFNA